MPRVSMASGLRDPLLDAAPLKNRAFSQESVGFAAICESTIIPYIAAVFSQWFTM